MKPLDRVTVIRQSLSVFVCGIGALLPLIGFVPAVCALLRAAQIHRGYHEFNPAAAYARWGVRFALLGISVTILAATAIGLSIASQAFR
jgi:hypothetical protein